MYLDGFLINEHATHIRRDRAEDASQVRLVRLARHMDQRASTSASLVERVTASFRPAPQPCPTC
jgi:hypothetical protein